MSNVYVVLDDLQSWPDDFPSTGVISFETYLAEHPIKGAKKTRIINLCNTDRYLSTGYYCSLLAEARGHKVIPSVNTLNDLGNQELYLLQAGALLAPLNRQASRWSEGEELRFKVYFGQVAQPELSGLARKLFERFACPILEVVLVWQGQWQLRDIGPVAYSALSAEESLAFRGGLESFTQSLWRDPRRRKTSRWDLAILVNPDEAIAPSDSQALKRIERAARKVGFLTEFVQAADYARLGEFDALFIRETTEIDHHTYRFARKAEIEGLVVMDDPTSILRCCNKVFLQDAFVYNGVPTPRTRIVAHANARDLDELEAQFGYPLVLKIPNAAFSVGVVKVENRQQLESRLTDYLSKSALVIAQEYLFTEFDWRIGVINNRPLYACRYYMARNHWQIYNHTARGSAGRVGSGGFDTLPTYEVPKAVLDAALKAARMIGDGLYGIDIKQLGSKVYVIEVNDNPSLDHGVEDAFLGDELYMQIMSEFARRLEKRGR